MDNESLLKISTLYQKLEQKPIYIYFIERDQNLGYGELTFKQIEQKFLTRGYRNIKSWQHEIIRHITHLYKSGNYESLEKKALKELRNYLEKKFTKIITFTPETWKQQWCDTYKQIAELYNSLPDHRKNIFASYREIGEHAPLSLGDMASIKRRLQTGLTPEQKQKVANLIEATEPGFNVDARLIVDLQSLKHNTLLTIHTYINSISDNSEEAIFIGQTTPKSPRSRARK